MIAGEAREAVPLNAAMAAGSMFCMAAGSMFDMAAGSIFCMAVRVSISEGSEESP